MAAAVLTVWQQLSLLLSLSLLLLEFLTMFRQKLLQLFFDHGTMMVVVLWSPAFSEGKHSMRRVHSAGPMGPSYSPASTLLMQNQMCTYIWALDSSAWTPHAWWSRFVQSCWVGTSAIKTELWLSSSSNMDCRVWFSLVCWCAGPSTSRRAMHDGSCSSWLTLSATHTSCSFGKSAQSLQAQVAIRRQSGTADDIPSAHGASCLQWCIFSSSWSFWSQISPTNQIPLLARLVSCTSLLFLKTSCSLSCCTLSSIA